MDNECIIMKNLEIIINNNIVLQKDYDDIIQVILVLIENLMLSEPILWAKYNYEDLIMID